MPSPRLLLLEDDPQLQEVLLRSLRAEGFDARAVGTAKDLLDRVQNGVPDAFVIDVGLPDADGRDVCQALRAQGIDTPVLFLTACDALTDRLSGFRAGGDDYVSKPFDIAELVARLQALMRRAGSDSAFEADGLDFDPTERTVTYEDTTVALTPTEFRLLAALAGRHGKPVARASLIGAAWPHGAVVHDNTLDVYIARLRRKLRLLASAPEIGTVHGTGYRLQQ